MRYQGSMPAGVPAGAGTGMLLVTGFSGSTLIIRQAILDSEDVRDVTVRRSGSQIEITVELKHRATVDKLQSIVDNLKEFDATIQGSQSIPIPTLVFSLVPVRTRQRGFLRRRLRQGADTSARKPPPQHPTLHGETVLSESLPVQAPPTVFAPPTPGPDEQTPEAMPGQSVDPVRLIAKSAGNAILHSISTELKQASAILGRSLRVGSSFTGRLVAHFFVRGVRTIFRSFVALPGAIPRISLVITTIGNSVFGTDANDESELDRPRPKDSRNA